jgi:hypothetical protein
MIRALRLTGALAALLALAACADTRPVVDPHNQVPFPGSKPVVDPDAVSWDPGGSNEDNLVQTADPAGDPRCTRLAARTLKPAFRCQHDGVSYVMQ